MLAFNILMIFLLVYFGLSTTYIFVFSISGLFYKQTTYQRSAHLRKFLILVPVYKRDDVIIEATMQNLKQDYPLFDLVVIADTLKQETIEELNALNIRVIKIENIDRTKAYAINLALEKIDKSYDTILILDADNVMKSPDFLHKINNTFEAGYKVVQAHRTSKNQDSNIAVLDGLSEEINNHIFRKGHRVLGLSASLIGSGMAIDFELFKRHFSKVVTSGEDKELEINLLDDGYRVEYLEDAKVLDEKTRNLDNFVNQRKRWIANQIYQAGNTGKKILSYLFHGKPDCLNKTFQNFLIPRIILLGTTLIFTFLTLIFQSSYFSYWLLLFSAVCISLLISIPIHLYNIKLLKALFSIPLGYFGMLVSTLKIRGANTKFESK